MVSNELMELLVSLVVWFLPVIAVLLLLRELASLQEDIVVLNDQLDILWEAVFEDDPSDPDEQNPPGSHSNIVAFKRSA